MILYPAMDLMAGRVVRLAQGRFEEATIYAADPAEALAAFAAAGARWAHIVDLDGARAGAPRQHDLIARLARETALKLQVAGGLRTRAQVLRVLDAGAARVVIGSLAVDEPDLVTALLEEVGSDRLALALDVKVEGDVPLVYTQGWRHYTGRSFYGVADDYPAATHFLVTDIDRDGMLRGPNVDLVSSLATYRPALAIQASGGVTGLPDLAALATAGAAGAVVGRALWEGRFTVAEALDAVA